MLGLLCSHTLWSATVLTMSCFLLNPCIQLAVNALVVAEKLLMPAGQKTADTPLQVRAGLEHG